MQMEHPTLQRLQSAHVVKLEPVLTGKDLGLGNSQFSLILLSQQGPLGSPAAAQVRPSSFGLGQTNTGENEQAASCGLRWFPWHDRAIGTSKDSFS